MFFKVLSTGKNKDKNEGYNLNIFLHGYFSRKFFFAKNIHAKIDDIIIKRTFLFDYFLQLILEKNRFLYILCRI